MRIEEQGGCPFSDSNHSEIYPRVEIGNKRKFSRWQVASSWLITANLVSDQDTYLAKLEENIKDPDGLFLYGQSRLKLNLTSEILSALYVSANIYRDGQVKKLNIGRLSPREVEPHLATLVSMSNRVGNISDGSVTRASSLYDMSVSGLGTGLQQALQAAFANRFFPDYTESVVLLKRQSDLSKLGLNNIAKIEELTGANIRSTPDFGLYTDTPDKFDLAVQRLKDNRRQVRPCMGDIPLKSSHQELIGNCASDLGVDPDQLNIQLGMTSIQLLQRFADRVVDLVAQVCTDPEICSQLSPLNQKILNGEFWAEVGGHLVQAKSLME